jgi:hypothetical protein
MVPEGEQTGFVCTTYIQETPQRVWQDHLRGLARLNGDSASGGATVRQPTQNSGGWGSEWASRHRTPGI